MECNPGFKAAITVTLYFLLMLYFADIINSSKPVPSMRRKSRLPKEMCFIFFQLLHQEKIDSLALIPVQYNLWEGWHWPGLLAQPCSYRVGVGVVMSSAMLTRGTSKQRIMMFLPEKNNPIMQIKPRSINYRK